MLCCGYGWIWIVYLMYRRNPVNVNEVVVRGVENVKGGDIKDWMGSFCYGVVKWRGVNPGIEIRRGVVAGWLAGWVMMMIL